MKQPSLSLLKCPKQINNLYFIFVVSAFFGCQETEESSAQFNASDESIRIVVGETDILPTVNRSLHSTTGLIEIGQASATPGGGPIGTEHQFQVEVFDEWEDEVSSVVLKADSGSRGTLEYMLIPDSADRGLYIISLESVGEAGEAREDTFTFSLWTGDAPEDTGASQ